MRDDDTFHLIEKSSLINESKNDLDENSGQNLTQSLSFNDTPVGGIFSRTVPQNCESLIIDRDRNSFTHNLNY